MNSSKRGHAAPVRGSSARPGQIRIVGGSLRSRRIDVPLRSDLRPTPDRVRETLFNWLGQNLAGLRCLDLYAGSGVLGFEAASRGAAHVVLVENDRIALAALRASRDRLAVAQVDIVAGDALSFLEATQEPFDLVFLDPPFRQNVLQELLARLASRVTPGARVYVEAPLAVAVPAPWLELRRSRAGQVSYQLLQWSSDEHDTSSLSGNV